VRRRDFITLLGGAAVTWPIAVRAQQPGKLPIIGILGLASAAAAAPYVNAVRVGLRDLGYVEGQNLIVEYRFGDGNYDRLPNLAAQLVHLHVDVLVTFAAPGTQAAKSATSTIPIVMAVTADADPLVRLNDADSGGDQRGLHPMGVADKKRNRSIDRSRGELELHSVPCQQAAASSGSRISHQRWTSLHGSGGADQKELRYRLSARRHY
jgi:ABC transporter substrate binding protein